MSRILAHRPGAFRGRGFQRPAGFTGASGVSRPSCHARNDQVSVASSICFASGLPMPCPALVSVRRRTGRPEEVWACSRAAILRACIGSTRLSLSAVVTRTAGEGGPSLAWGDGGERGQELELFG